jgi:hypothetical protein
MCNLYSLTKGQQAIRQFTRAMRDSTGNLSPLPGIFPDTMVPVVRATPEEMEVRMQAPANEALSLQRPLPDGMLKVAARGEKAEGAVAA